MKPIAKFEINRIAHFVDENSDEFRNALQKCELEISTTPFKFNSSVIINGISPTTTQYSVANRACYEYIDIDLYKELSELLEQEGLGHCLDDVCSIIKWAYYQLIWIKLNEKQIEKIKEFRAELKKMVSILQQNIYGVQILGNFKGKHAKLWDAEIVRIIVEAIKEKIGEQADLVGILLVDSKYDTQYAIGKTTRVPSQLIFSLIVYLHTKTNYQFNSPPKSKAINNNLAKFVLKLIEPIAHLHEFGYTPKYVRTMFNNFLSQHPSLEVFLDRTFKIIGPGRIFDAGRHFGSLFEYTFLYEWQAWGDSEIEDFNREMKGLGSS